VLGLTDLELPVVELRLVDVFDDASTSRATLAMLKRQTRNIKTHVEFLALKDVTISTTALTRSGSDDGEETTSLELLLEDGVDFSVLLALVENSLDVVGLGLVTRLLGGLGTSVDGLGVVSLVPLTEGGGVDVDNGGLDKGLGTEKLVVGSVVSLGSVRVLRLWCSRRVNLPIFLLEYLIPNISPSDLQPSSPYLYMDKIQLTT